MEPGDRAAQRGAAGFFERLMPPVVQAREYHRRRAIGFGILALAIVALGVFGAPDELGLVLSLILAAVVGFRAAYHAWRLRRVAPQEEYATRIDGLPETERPAAFRRVLLMSAVVFPLFSAWLAWNLYRIEAGLEESVTVWAPIAWIYRFLGFWPAVLTVPALGALVIHGAWKKKRAADAIARSAPPASAP